MLGRGGVNGAGCWEAVAFDPLKLISLSLLLILLDPGWAREGKFDMRRGGGEELQGGELDFLTGITNSV